MVDIVIYFMKELISVLIGILLMGMFVRMIVEMFFDPMGESKIFAFVFMLTEPITLPIRALCAKMHWFEGSPLDVPFVLTSMVLALIDVIISML